MVNRIAQTPTGYNDRPLENEVMQTVTVGISRTGEALRIFLKKYYTVLFSTVFIKFVVKIVVNFYLEEQRQTLP